MCVKPVRSLCVAAVAATAAAAVAAAAAATQSANAAATVARTEAAEADGAATTAVHARVEHPDTAGVAIERGLVAPRRLRDPLAATVITSPPQPSPRRLSHRRCRECLNAAAAVAAASRCHCHRLHETGTWTFVGGAAVGGRMGSRSDDGSLCKCRCACVRTCARACVRARVRTFSRRSPIDWRMISPAYSTTISP
jgi:hypothetical protein